MDSNRPRHYSVRWSRAAQKPLPPHGDEYPHSLQILALWNRHFSLLPSTKPSGFGDRQSGRAAEDVANMDGEEFDWNTYIFGNSTDTLVVRYFVTKQNRIRADCSQIYP